MNAAGKPGVGAQPTLEEMGPVQLEAAWEKLVPAGWSGSLSGLSEEAIRAFWVEAVGYARWEIGRYRAWRKMDEPVLGNGYDAEGVVQAAFERLIERDQVFQGVEEIRRELRGLVKRRVGWLHGRKERRLTVREWDVVPARGEGVLVSAFDRVAGGMREPKEELMRKEEAERAKKFKEAFEASLGQRKDLLKVFRQTLDGASRREIARDTGMKANR